MEIIINNMTDYNLSNYIEVTERAAAAALTHETGHETGQLSVTFVTSDEMRALNNRYRGIDGVTDVLSFPAGDADAPETLGDIIICFDRACAQAHSFGNTNKREIAFLTVHGVLHLLGYDHMNPEDEEVMTRAQKEIMRVFM